MTDNRSAQGSPIMDAAPAGTREMDGVPGPRRKILVIGKYYHPFDGGIEHVTRLFARELAGRYDVTVIASAHDDSHGDSVHEGVTVRRLRTNLRLMSQPMSASLFPALRLRDVDLVQIHVPNPFAVCALWLAIRLQGYRGHLVLSHHMDIQGRAFVRRILAPFYTSLARRADWVSVTSRKNFEISRDLPRDARIVTLPLCIDTDDYPADEARREQALAWRRASFGEAPLVGFVGRHARYKGLDVLVRAVAALPGVVAVIAGDGPYRAGAMALAQALGVADRVHFPGPVSHQEKLRLLAAIDVFAFPSTETTEGFGVTQLEAMVLGAVVVAGDLPTGVTDVALDERTALLARPGDAAHLAAQIGRILADPALADRLRRDARRHVEANFSQRAVLSELNRLVDSTFAGTATR